MANPFATETELLVLRLLRCSLTWRYGLDLVSESNGKLRRATLYVTLGKLEAKGFVESRIEERRIHISLPRSVYRITGLGQKALAASELMGGCVVRI